MSTFTACAFAMWPTVTNNDNIAFSLCVSVCSRFQQHRKAKVNVLGESPHAEVAEHGWNILGFL